MGTVNKASLVTLLCELNSGNFTDYEEDSEVLFKDKFEKTTKNLKCTYNDIVKITSAITDIFDSKLTYEWKFVCLNFYILELLNNELSKSEKDVLTVQEMKNLKIALQNLMLVGILKNLQKNVPHSVQIEKYREPDVIYTYTLLKCTVFGFCKYIKYPNLRMLILPHCLQGILVSLLQLGYAPLKKPTKSNVQDGFIMSESMYTKLLSDQSLFKEILETLRQNIHPAIFVKETMNLFQNDAPSWFKKSVSTTLTKIIRSQKGVEHIALAMLDGTDDDTTKTWKILDVLTKLIIECRKFPDFQRNICVQVLDLLSIMKTAKRDLFIFERLVVSCTKALYSEDKDLCKTVFLNRIMTPLLYFAYKEHKFRDGDDVANDIKQTVRLIYGCFVDNSVNAPCLPLELLRSVVNVMFQFYHLTVQSSFPTLNKELKEILIKYLKCCTNSEIHLLFDCFLFGIAVTDVPQFRNDVVVEIDKEIIVKHSQHTIIYATAATVDTIYNLLETDQKIILFGYLLECITDKEKYFATTSNKELLNAENHSTCAVLERLLTIHKLLSRLAENESVQTSLRNKPDDVINYINNVLSHEIKKEDSKNTDSQFIFTVVMILDNLIANSSSNTLEKYRILTEPLSKIAAKTSDVELKSLCEKIVTVVCGTKVQSTNKAPNEITELEKALEDIYDPLLPVRGHGLLVLTKLVERKNQQAMERKQFLLNLFQLSLKDEDSFIYLNAVQGLAAMADVFPDTVLEVLCEEYADVTKKNNYETRMKLGEVLIRVIKLLGEMAPKYKSLLLNTFLSGTKDDDHLMRASSLSNLGEVCGVLNYKLGTIVTEVLVCVYAVITTDKAVEARRAAVTVIRRLFAGLQTEMISFLKEDILPIYRTLKEIYYHDKDDVMRLQAQLALEELNENMKSFVFPKPQLSFEKKIVMLD